MNQETHVLGLKCFENLIQQQGYLICQQTGGKITRVEDLATIHLGVGEDHYVFLPVHKEYAKLLLTTLVKTFDDGLPSLQESETTEYCWRE